MKIYTDLDVDGDILLSGRLYKYYRTSSSIPMILAGTNNRNITLLRVSSSSITGWATGGRSAYGFSLKYTGYTGKGEGVDNNLVLYADNQDNEAQNIAIAVNQTGQVGIRADPSTSYSLYVNGDANISGTLYQGGTAVSLTGHVHNYAGSSSVGGAATSAVKLATARTITLTGNVTGSGTFDGSGDLTIDVQPKVAYPSQSGTVKDELAWQRIATMELPAEHIGNSKYTIILDIMPDVTSIAGRLTASISYNGDDTPTTTGTPVFRWDWCNSTIDPAQWIIAYTVTADDTYPRQAEIWCYNKYYGSHHIVQVDTYIREGGEDIWDLKTNKDDILKKPSWKDAPGRTATDEGATQVINGVTVKWKALTSSRGVLANNTTGNAATATALTSNAGNTYLPVYFTGGRPVACTVKNNNNGTLGYGGSENSALITVTTLSFWNGTYSAGSSNLRYAVPPLADGAAQSGTGKPCKPIATTDYAQHQVTYSSEVPDSGNEGDVCFIPDDHEERIQELEAKADGLSTGSGSLGNSLAELSGRMTAAEGGISGLQSDMQGKVDAVSGMGLSHVDVTTSMTDVWDGKQDAIPAGTYAPYCSDGYLPLTGGEVSGNLTIGGGLHAVGLDSDATGNGAQLRIVGGNYGYMVRNDGNATYGLMTSQNSPYGGWTTARPWVISNSDGVMSINGNANTATYLSGDNMSGTLTISKSNWTGGRPADGDVRVWSQKWVDSGLGTDTADLNIWLHKVSDSAVTANLSIDGQIYAMGGFVGHASSDLPLTGGTLTGDLVLSGDRQVKNKVDNSLLRIQGGSAENKGARIVLSGKDRTNYQGVAEIIAHDGTNSSTFTLNANGDANLNRGLFVANRVVAKDYTYKLSSEPTGDDLYVWSNARYEMHGSDGKCIAYLRPQIGTQENSLVLNIANKTSTASGSFKLWSNGDVWTQGFIDSSGDIRSYKNAPCIYLQNKAFDMETTNYADGDTLSMFYFRDAAGRPLAVLENAPHRHIEDDGAVRTHNVLRMTVRKPDNSGWMSTPLYIGWGSATGNNNYEYCSLPMATVSATTSEGVALYLRNKSNNGVARQVFLERSNNGWTGMVESQWGTDGKKHIRMKTHSEKSNTWDYVGITGNTSSESTAFTTHCPTPPSTSDTTEIATTEWVNDKVFGGEFQVESPNPAGSNVYRKIYECDFSGILAWHTWMLDFDVYDAWYSTTMTATYHVQIHSNSTAGQIVVSGASPPTPQISCVGHHGTSVLGVGDVILAYSNTDKKAQVWIHVTASQSQFVFKRNVSSDRSAVNHKVWTACPSASWTSSLPDEDKYTYIYATQIFERPITYESSVPSAGDEGDVCFIPDDHEDRISALETELFNNTVDQSVQYQRKIIYGTSSTPPSGCSEGDIYIQIQE